MKETEPFPAFALFGGPLHRLGQRWGLVRDQTNSLRLGIALGLLTWGVLMLLALIEGAGQGVFSLAVIGLHARLLLAIPLFFVCETWVAPRMAEFVRNIVRSGLVPKSVQPELALEVRRIDRLKDSWLVELVMLLVALLPTLIETMASMSSLLGSLSLMPGRTGLGLSWGEGWYLGFCLPLFRFLLLRWFWRLILWGHFLWRVERLDLHLVPTHSDGAAGLGFLEVVHEHFTPLALAFSAIMSASFTENYVSGLLTFETLYGLAPMVLALIALLFLGPLFTFSRKLWRCRTAGMNEYMVLAAHYVDAFERKWIKADRMPAEEGMDIADVQSLADLTSSVSVVRDMRWAPVSRRLVVELAAAGILPLLPLMLLKFPPNELAVMLFKGLTGM